MDMELGMISKRGVIYLLLGLVLLLLALLVYAITVNEWSWAPATATITTGANVSYVRILQVNLTNGAQASAQVFNITNVSFYAQLPGGLPVSIGDNTTANQTFYTLTWNTLSTSNFPDNASWTVFANASATNMTSQGNVNLGTGITSVRIDNTVPTVTFINTNGSHNPDSTNFFNATGTPFFINFNATDAGYGFLLSCAYILDPNNNTQGGNLTSISAVLNNTEITNSFNTSAIMEGTRQYAVRCTDNEDTNNTVNSTRTLVVDTTPPMINISFFDIAGVEKTSFGFGSEVMVKCLRGDTTAGLNYTEIFFQNPVEATLQSKRIDQSLVLGSTSLFATEFVIDSSETRNLGVYQVGCNAIDRAGIIYRTNKTFDIVTQAPRSTSAFAIPGFTAPVGKVKINSGITSDGGKLGPDGISRLMQAGASLKLDIKGQDHTITVVTVSDESVTLRITSEPFTITVNKGETVDADLDRDGTNDLAVTYHKRFPPGGKHADLTFALTETPAVETAPEGGAETPEEKAAREAARASKAGLLVTLVVIVIIIVLGYFMLSKRKR